MAVDAHARKITVKINEQDAKRLDHLTDYLEADSTTELLNTSLRVLEDVVLRYELRKPLYEKKEDGSFVPYELFKEPN